MSPHDDKTRSDSDELLWHEFPDEADIELDEFDPDDTRTRPQDVLSREESTIQTDAPEPTLTDAGPPLAAVMRKSSAGMRARTSPSTQQGIPAPAPDDMPDAVPSLPIDMTEPLLDIPDEPSTIDSYEIIEAEDIDDAANVTDEFPRRVFVREALHLAREQPDRAALMWLHAANLSEWELSGDDVTTADLQRALDLRPDSPWLLPLARYALMRMGHYDGAVKVGMQEVKLGGDPGNRAAVLLEMAAVQHFVLGDPDGAVGRIEHAEQLHPAYVAALSIGAALRIGLQQPGPAADTLVRLSDTLASNSERALFLYAAGTLYEGPLQRPDLAEEAYTRALEADPKHLPALQALATYYGDCRTWDKLTRCLERLADLVPDSQHKIRLLVEAGSLHLLRTRDVRAGIRDLKMACEVAPEELSLRAVARLAQAYEDGGRFRELVETLRLQMTLTPDEASRAALLTRIGDILQTYLEDAEGAAEAYTNAVELLDGYLTPLEALTGLHRRSRDHAKLLGVLARQVEANLPDSVRAAIAHEMGDLLSDAGRWDNAVLAYKRALDIRPRMRLAMWGLARSLEALGRFEELVEVLRAERGVATDERARIDLTLEIADVQAGPLEDPTGALATLDEVNLDGQGRSVLRLKWVFCEATGRWSDLVELAFHIAQDSSDPHETVGWLLRAARILELKLDEPGRALDTYKQVLRTESDNVVAIFAIRRISLRQQKWEELLELYNHELSIDPQRVDAALIHQEMGRILSDQLGRQDEAVKAYRKAVEAAGGSGPGVLPSLLALERLARNAGSWVDLIEVLRTFAAATFDKRAGADALCRAAEICDAELDNVGQAVELFNEAIKLDPDPAYPGYGLYRMRRRQAEWKAAAALLQGLDAESPSAEEQARLRLTLARVREFHLQMGPDLALLTEASDSIYGGTLRGELLRVRRAVQADDLEVELRRLGSTMEDAVLGSAMLLEAAIGVQLDSSGRTGLDDAKLAYEKNPADPVALWTLDRALWREERWALLAQLREEAAAREREPLVRAGLLSGAVSAYMEAEDQEATMRVAKECLQLDNRHIPALMALANLAEFNEDWAQFADMSDRLAAASTYRANRLEFSLRAAELWAQDVGNSQRALASLQIALRENPDDELACRLAETQLRHLHDFDGLSRLYNNRIKACPDPERKAELLRTHALILRDECDDLPGATAQLAQLLLIKENDVAALTDLKTLLLKQKRWADAAKALDQLIVNTHDPGARHQARLTLAELRLERLHEPDRARKLLEEALAEFPTDINAVRMMVMLTRTIGDWESARAEIDQFVQATRSTVEATWALIELADVARNGLWDKDLARCSEIEALERSADDPEAVDLVYRDFQAREETRRFVELGSEVVSRSGVQAMALRRKIAGVVIDDVGDAGSGKKIAKGILQRAPDDMEARLLLARSYELDGAMEKAAKEYRTVAVKAPYMAEAYAGLYKVHKQLGHPYISGAARSILAQLDENAPKAPKLPKRPDAQAPELKLNQLPLPEELHELQVIMELAAPWMNGVFAQPAAGKAVFPDSPAAKDVTEMATIVGLEDVSITFGATNKVLVSFGRPTVLTVPKELEEDLSGGFRFWVGRGLALAAGAGALVTGLGDQDLTNMVAAMWAGWRESDPAVKELRGKVNDALSRTAKKTIKQYEQPSTSAGHWAAYRKAENHRSDLIGIVMSRNPGAALAAIAESERKQVPACLTGRRYQKLLKFILSDSYAKLARQLWG